MTTRNSHPGASRALVAVALLALVTAACTGGADPSSAGASGTEPATEPVTAISQEPSMDTEPSVPGDGVVPPAIMQAAVDDAAARAGVDPGTVTVVSGVAVTFPNGALGCPEPGMMYTEVLTPGYHVVVEAGGTAYDYRASARGGSLKWCEDPPPAG